MSDKEDLKIKRLYEAHMLILWLTTKFKIPLMRPNSRVGGEEEWLMIISAIKCCVEELLDENKTLKEKKK